MFAMGLNPYGLTYHLGLQGHGTPRANPDGRGLDGFLAIAEELGVETIEIFEPWLATLTDANLSALRDRLDRLGMTPVVSSGLQAASMPSIVRFGARARRHPRAVRPDVRAVRRPGRARGGLAGPRRGRARQAEGGGGRPRPSRG